MNIFNSKKEIVIIHQSIPSVQAQSFSVLLRAEHVQIIIITTIIILCMPMFQFEWSKEKNTCTWILSVSSWQWTAVNDWRRVDSWFNLLRISSERVIVCICNKFQLACCLISLKLMAIYPMHFFAISSSARYILKLVFIKIVIGNNIQFCYEIHNWLQAGQTSSISDRESILYVESRATFLIPIGTQSSMRKPFDSVDTLQWRQWSFREFVQSRDLCAVHLELDGVSQAEYGGQIFRTLLSHMLCVPEFDDFLSFKQNHEQKWSYKSDRTINIIWFIRNQSLFLLRLLWNIQYRLIFLYCIFLIISQLFSAFNR